MNDWTAQKIHSNSCNRQSILSGGLYSKTFTHAGLTDETKIVFLKLGIWRRRKQGLFLSWFAINIFKRLIDGWKIHHHGRCMNGKGRHDRHGSRLTENHWHCNWKQINAGNRQTYHATKTNRTQRQNKKYGLWRIMIVTVIVRFVMWNFPMMIKTDSNERRNRTRKGMIEQNLFEFAFTMFFHACKTNQRRIVVNSKHFGRIANKNHWRIGRDPSMENWKRLTVANYTERRNQKDFVTFTGFCGRDFNACLFWTYWKKWSDVLLSKKIIWNDFDFLHFDFVGECVSNFDLTPWWIQRRKIQFVRGGLWWRFQFVILSTQWENNENENNCTTIHWSENIWLIEKPWKSIFDFFVSKTFHEKTNHEKTFHW